MIAVILLIAFAVFGYKIAERNGRDPIIACAICFIFGALGVLGYIIAGKKND